MVFGRKSEGRARWTRTWHNKDEGQGDIVLNSPDGWMIEDPGLHWQGSDNLARLLSESRGAVKLGDTWGEKGRDLHTSGGAFPAITRATSLIADTLAGLPWEVVRGRETLVTPPWVGDPALSRPDLRVSSFNAEGVNPLSAVSWRSQLLTSALWYGDAFVLTLARDVSGQPIPPLFMLHPALVEVVTPAMVGQQAQWTEPGYWVEVASDHWIRLGNDEVIQVRGMGPYWNGRGVGVLTQHWDSWQAAQALRSYCSGLYTAGIPAGYLKVTAPNLTEDQANDLKKKWAANHGGGTREVAVLNAVTDFTPIQLPPEQAQMVEATKMGILDVANAFGVEPYMLGLPSDGSTYANIESRSLHFVRYTLLPWVRRVEAALDHVLPKGTEVKINLDSLLRADSSARVAYYSQGLADGWLTREEVRASEGLPDIPLPDVRQDPPVTAGATTEEAVA
jgi:HK97 family phage portal protein